MPVELHREVPAHRRTDTSVLERLALVVAVLGFTVGMLLIAFAWSWM